MALRLGFEPSPITLGSAQLGMAYGVANTAGQPSEAGALAILDRAVALGITTIDTARAYGDAETRIGKWLAARNPAGVNVLTKIPPLPASPGAERRQRVHDHIVASIAALGVRPLPLVMVHEEADLLDPHVVDAFEAAVGDGAIARFGASVYQPAVAERLIAAVPVAALQIPASIADHVDATSPPSGVVAPSPVTTTLTRSLLPTVVLRGSTPRTPRCRGARA